MNGFLSAPKAAFPLESAIGRAKIACPFDAFIIVLPPALTRGGA